MAGQGHELDTIQNIGTVSNRGWEISLNADAIDSKDWKWNIGVDATFLKTKS